MIGKNKKTKSKSIRKERIYNPKKIYLITTMIASDCNKENSGVIRNVTQYYLATKEGEKYYELFSKVELKYEDTEAAGFKFSNFNIPVIKEVEKLEKYVKHPNAKRAADELFYFITKMNAEKEVLEDSKQKDEEQIKE